MATGLLDLIGQQLLIPTMGQIAYLLRDEFTDARAAGSVDGTPATPGPGTRSVVDTNDKLTVASGGLAVATGGAGVNNPRLYYDTFARLAGRVLLASVNVTTEGVIVAASDANTAARQSGIRLYDTSIAADIGAAAWVAIGAYSTGTVYDLAIVVRAGGEYCFIRGGAFTNWTLLWVGGAGAGDPLYPIVSADDSTSVCTVSFLRIPDVLWLPTPLAYDTFTRANGALGSSEASGPDSQGVAARTWNNRVGTTQIASNKASASALVGGEALATVDTGTVSVIAQADLARAGGNVGIALRYADTSNYIIAYHDGTNAKLDKIVGGVTTNVISGAKAYAANAAIVVVADGTSFSLFYNNSKIGSTSTISDAGLQTGTEHGLYSTNVGNTQDVFLVMPRGSNDEYLDLEKWSAN